MTKLMVENDIGDATDVSCVNGALELVYKHRNLLMLSLMKQHPKLSWISGRNCVGHKLDNLFVAGINLPEGNLVFMMPIDMWELACNTDALMYERALTTTLTSEDIIKNLENIIHN